MSRLCMVIALIMAATGSISVNAQTRPTLSIITEDLDDAATKCGVNKQTLRAPAILTLRNNRISVNDNFTLPHVYIRANFMSINDQSCVWSLSVDIRGYVPAIARNGFMKNNSDSFGNETILLCSISGHGISPRIKVSKRLSDSVEEYLKQCLSQVDY